MPIAVITDCHLVAGGRTLYGLDPVARLRAAIAAIAAREPRPTRLVITGDLVHWPDEASYETLREALSGWTGPRLLLLGNHDDRRLFTAAFPDAPRDSDGFVQSVHIDDEATLIGLDTLDETAADGSGVLCPRRLAFLERALRAAPADRPVLVFLHHPPVDTGLAAMDTIKLREADRLLAVFATTRRPDHIVFGHVHRPISGTWHGIPFHTFRSPSHQLALDLTTHTDVPGSHEPPDYALILVREQTILIHQCAFLYDGPVFSLLDPTVV